MEQLYSWDEIHNDGTITRHFDIGLDGIKKNFIRFCRFKGIRVHFFPTYEKYVKKWEKKYGYRPEIGTDRIEY